MQINQSRGWWGGLLEGWWYLLECYTDGGDVYADASHYANAAKLGPTFVLICTNTVTTPALHCPPAQSVFRAVTVSSPCSFIHVAMFVPTLKTSTKIDL